MKRGPGDIRSRKWQFTFNNPAEHGWLHEAIKAVFETMPNVVYWCMSDEIGDEGTYHTHVFVVFTSQVWRSRLIELFHGGHFEPCNGTCQENRDYVFKEGKWLNDPKGETNLRDTHEEFGECPDDRQGRRTDFDFLQECLDANMTFDEVLDISFKYIRYESYYKQEQFRRRLKEIPELRDMYVEWHVGESRSGKSYTRIKLIEKYGSSEVYVVTDYTNPFDEYKGEKVIVLDEFRGQVPYSVLMNWLDRYKNQLKCRYRNGYALWTEVHICTILPPEIVYAKMVQEYQSYDTYKQLKERLDVVTYHYIEDGEYKTFSQGKAEYTDYEALKLAAKGFEEFEPEQLEMAVPF